MSTAHFRYLVAGRGKDSNLWFPPPSVLKVPGAILFCVIVSQHPGQFSGSSPDISSPAVTPGRIHSPVYCPVLPHTGRTTGLRRASSPRESMGQPGPEADRPGTRGQITARVGGPLRARWSRDAVAGSRGAMELLPQGLAEIRQVWERPWAPACAGCIRGAAGFRPARTCLRRCGRGSAINGRWRAVTW